MFEMTLEEFEEWKAMEAASVTGDIGDVISDTE